MKTVQQTIDIIRTEQEDERRNVERSILGALIIEPRNIPRVMDILSPANFLEISSYIYLAIRNAYKAGPVDHRTVTHQLHPLLKGHRQYTLIEAAVMICDCTDRVHSAANLETHALLLVEMSILDQLLMMYDKLPDKDQLIEAYVQDLLENISMSDSKLDTLVMSIPYFEKVLPEHPYTAGLQELRDNIYSKAKQVRKREHLRHTIDMLTSVSDYSGDRDTVEGITSLLFRALNGQLTRDDKVDIAVLLNRKPATV